MLSIDDNRWAGAGTSLTRIVAASLVCLLAAACAETPTAPRDTTLPTGRWTGDGACLSVAVDGCDLVVACGHGQFAQPFTLAARSRSAAPIASKRDPSASTRRRRRRFQASGAAKP